MPQPNYMNAMTQGLSMNLEFLKEGKKGGIRSGRGRGGKTEPSNIERDRAKHEKQREDLKTSNKLRRERTRIKKGREEAREVNKLAGKTKAAEFALEEKTADSAIKKNESTRIKDFTTRAKGFWGNVTPDNLDDYTAWSNENGLNFPTMITEQEAKKMSPKVWENWHKNFWDSNKKEIKSRTKGQIESDLVERWLAGDSLTKTQQEIVNHVYKRTEMEKDKKKKEISAAIKREEIGEKRKLGTMREALAKDDDAEETFDSYSNTYNEESRNNEVVYWHTSTFDNKTKFIKLSERNITNGWTPAKIQEAANAKGKTVEEVLTDLGEL